MVNFQSMKHLKKRKLPKKLPYDMLDAIFRRQLELNKKYPYWKDAEMDPNLMSKTYVLAMLSETSELLDQLNWKPWKKQQKPIELEELRYEIVDLLIFVICLAQIWGMSSRDLMEYYLAKTEENHDRIKRGY
jgi:NTP pyrophosphatase (non-canonical NTP hydrolase)